MNDVLIIGEPNELSATIDQSLAALGFEPYRVAPGTAIERTTMVRIPVLIVVVDGVEQAVEQLTADDELSRVPTIVVADEARLATGSYAAVGNELIVSPFTSRELQARVGRARYGVRNSFDGDLLVSGSLEINRATYQVTVDGKPIDFTYMEYELLKFFVVNPDRVFSREALLSNVWGYDYYGGARTVDVHIRRLRAKLGPEHAERIRTLRSVGYRWEGRTD
ncbi:MAG: response regulator transcription factor [Solirubrobacteraceae bacterium]|nr:response regulator transcription factor [Solirubrobacteraceae bacterium]